MEGVHAKTMGEFTGYFHLTSSMPAQWEAFGRIVVRHNRQLLRHPSLCFLSNATLKQDFSLQAKRARFSPE
jgi:hypothetical protein